MHQDDIQHMCINTEMMKLPINGIAKDNWPFFLRKKDNWPIGLISLSLKLLFLYAPDAGAILFPTT
jgi:hypothetical protein